MLWKRKGISPLIATVLIIGFTVALAAIIMTWGSSFTKGMQTQAEQSSNIQMKCAQDVALIVDAACISGGNLKVTMKNNGAMDITNMTARLFADSTTVAVVDGIKTICTTLTTPAGLSKYGIASCTVTLPQGSVTSANIKRVEVVPVITIEGTTVPCAQTLGEFGDAAGTVLSPCA